MSIFFKLFFLACFIYVFTTYAIRRVWLLNHADISEDIPVPFSVKSLLLFLQEYFFHCLQILLLLADYLLTPVNFVLKKLNRPCECDIQPPVILIHGYMMRGGVLWPMQHYLKRKGFKCVSLFTYEKPWQDITVLAEQLAREVDKVISRCKTDKVDLVAHSMGGLVARYYINYLDGDRRVARLVTLGTPHNGTHLWALSSFKSGVQMRPESQFLGRLEENDEKLQTVRIWSIYTDFDELIIPEDSPVLKMKNVINRKIPDIGHAGLEYHWRVYQEIIEALRRKIS